MELEKQNEMLKKVLFDKHVFTIEHDATLEEVEMLYINYILNRFDGNKTQACKFLDISIKTIYNKLDKGGDNE
jgi:DNA-binding NtrC family response regulator